MKNRWTKIVLSCLLLAGFLTTQTSAANASTTSDEAQFIELINELRSSLGLQTLTPSSGLSNAAANWTAVLANVGELSHAPDLSAGVTASWAKLGENVGVASEGQTQQLFDAFVASPSHYANLIDPDFQYVGVAVLYDDTGRMWTTHRFMRTFDTPAPTTTPPTTAAPTTLPPSTIPPSTSPPEAAIPSAPAQPTTSTVPESTTTTSAAPAQDNGDTRNVSTAALNAKHVVQVLDDLAIAGI